MMSGNCEIESTPIQEFYAGAKIFITGGTGFLGRILVEKLLRSCPDIHTIYLLVRQKKEKSTETRLKELFADVIFNKLKESEPHFEKKVVGICGDCVEPHLGISEENRNILIKEATIVFHSAATVNFDEKLQRATFINVRGTRDVIALCKEMRNLKFITHVSTAYAHCYRSELDEEFYESPYKAKELVAIAENLPSDTVDKLTEILIENFPNTYAFTKTISEEILMHCDGLPLAVYRPSIIVSTLREPVPGWINNFYGPQGVSTAAMLGVMRSLHCDENAGSNIVPVDMVVNALIAVPWQCRSKFDRIQSSNADKDESLREKYETPIYHYESNTYRPITWKTFRYLTHLHGQKYPTTKMIGDYFFHLRKSIVSHTIAIVFMHYLPALLVDAALVIGGKKAMLFKAYKKIHRFSAVIAYFSTRQWHFKSNNLGKLCDAMAPADKELFFCDLRRLDWDLFFQTYLLGCRKYLLKDEESTEKAFKRLFRIKMITYATLGVLAMLLCSFAYCTFS